MTLGSRDEITLYYLGGYKPWCHSSLRENSRGRLEPERKRRRAKVEAETGETGLAKGRWATRVWMEQSRSLPERLERKYSPAATGSSDFWSPELWEDKCLLFKDTWFMAIRCGSHRKRIQVMRNMGLQEINQSWRYDFVSHRWTGSI